MELTRLPLAVKNPEDEMIHTVCKREKSHQAIY